MLDHCGLIVYGLNRTIDPRGIPVFPLVFSASTLDIAGTYGLFGGEGNVIRTPSRQTATCGATEAVTTFTRQYRADAEVKILRIALSFAGLNAASRSVQVTLSEEDSTDTAAAAVPRLCALNPIASADFAEPQSTVRYFVPAEAPRQAVNSRRSRMFRTSYPAAVSVAVGMPSRNRLSARTTGFNSAPRHPML